MDICGQSKTEKTLEDLKVVTVDYDSVLAFNQFNFLHVYSSVPAVIRSTINKRVVFTRALLVIMNALTFEDLLTNRTPYFHQIIHIGSYVIKTICSYD